MSNHLPSPAYSSKLISRDQAQQICQKAYADGKKVVYTSGVFDLLHQGHVDYLARAHALGDLLILGLNSDASVRANKGPLRPIQNQQSRSHIIAALESVSYVFVFEEQNNNKNIELLQPHIYAKAGDYSSRPLTSAPIVEAYGGQVQLIPFVGDFSSSAIIDTIVDRYGTTQVTFGKTEAQTAPQKAIFFDRDGTVLELVDYLHTEDKMKFIEGAADALGELTSRGFRLLMSTNQPGIGFGYFSEEDFYKINKMFLRTVGKKGAKIDKILVCSHTEATGCECRKPKTTLIDSAVEELGIDRSQSYFIGDSTSDIETGKRSGLTTILVKTGEGGNDGKFEVKPDFTVATFAEALRIIS